MEVDHGFGVEDSCGCAFCDVDLMPHWKSELRRHVHPIKRWLFTEEVACTNKAFRDLKAMG